MTVWFYTGGGIKVVSFLACEVRGMAARCFIVLLLIAGTSWMMRGQAVPSAAPAANIAPQAAVPSSGPVLQAHATMVLVDVVVTEHDRAIHAIDPRGIVFTPDEKGALEAKIELLLVGYNSEGGRVNYLDRGFSLSLTEDRYRQALAHGLPIRMELDMPPGPGFLRAAVHDLTAGRAGSVEAAIQAK
jgi:hypothetical protein